jgi:trimethylamine---corrinoid protein Co-methyltransferase
MSTKGFVRKFKPLEILTEEQVRAIHLATLDVLETTGVRMEHDRGLKLLEKHGCMVDWEQKRVRMPSGLVEECLAQVPSHFRLRARNPKNDLLLGGDRVYFQTFAGMESIDLETWEPRPPTRKENYEAVLVQDASPNLHFLSTYTPWFGWKGLPPVMAIPESDASRLRYSTKAIETGSSYDSEVFAIQLAQAVGADVLGYMGGSPPLTWYENAIEACFRLVGAGFPLQVISGNTMGANAPASIAGSTVTNNAELMSGIVLAQLIRPGTPMMVMDFCFPQNMRGGGPLFGDIGAFLHNVVFNQIWRSYGIPTKTPPAGASNSKQIDYQCGYEKAIGALLNALSGTNVVPLQGGLNGELTRHPLITILDDDMAAMIGRFLEGVEVTDDSVALDLINEVGPIPGFYLDKAHTRHWWRKEQVMTSVADRLTYPEWMRTGKKSALDYAKARMEEIVATHRPEPLTPQQEQAVEDVLKEARGYYRKKGLISEDDWLAYLEQLESPAYPYA